MPTLFLSFSLSRSSQNIPRQHSLCQRCPGQQANVAVKRPPGVCAPSDGRWLLSGPQLHRRPHAACVTRWGELLLLARSVNVKYIARYSIQISISLGVCQILCNSSCFISFLLSSRAVAFVGFGGGGGGGGRYHRQHNLCNGLMCDDPFLGSCQEGAICPGLCPSIIRTIRDSTLFSLVHVLTLRKAGSFDPISQPGRVGGGFHPPPPPSDLSRGATKH